MNNTSVLQDWLVVIPIRMQSTLLLSLRGPDTHRCQEIKKIQRWMRGIAFKPGNPANVKEFMAHADELPQIIEKSPVARELEFCTQHFYSHLMHGLEVIGYCHWDLQIRQTGVTLFQQMCSLMHLVPETRWSFHERLKPIDWPEGQPDTFTQAIAQLEANKLKEIP